MPLALALVGLLLIVSAARGTHRALGQQFAQDVGGPRGFVWWVLALAILGVLGAWKPLRLFSRSLIGLALLAFVLSNRNVFGQGVAAFRGERPRVVAEALPQAPTSGSGSGTAVAGNQRRGGGGVFSALAGAVGGAIGTVVGGPVGGAVGAQLGGAVGGAVERG